MTTFQLAPYTSIVQAELSAVFRPKQSKRLVRAMISEKKAYI